MAKQGENGIGWTDITWSPVTGCTPVSAGCDHCWARRMSRRTFGTRAFSEVHCHSERLDQPLRWRKPRKIATCLMGDMFHADVPAKFIVDVFEVMAACPQHTFQILTKRPERIASVLFGEEGRFYLGGNDYLPNVILGTSVEDQATADDRIPKLLASGWVGKFFVSFEPAIGPVDLFRWLEPFKTYDPMLNKEPILDWVIAGGESGPGARPAHPNWFRKVRDDCQAAGVAHFFKQRGEWSWDGLPDKPTHNFCQHGTMAPIDSWAWPCLEHGCSIYAIARVGKKRAGRLLDGREHNEFPEVK